MVTRFDENRGGIVHYAGFGARTGKWRHTGTWGQDIRRRVQKGDGIERAGIPDSSASGQIAADVHEVEIISPCGAATRASNIESAAAQQKGCGDEVTRDRQLGCTPHLSNA